MAGIALLALPAWGFTAAPAAAQSSRSIRPWTPPAADSVVSWAAEARTRFQSPLGDSATGPNQRAYDLVGKIGRRLLFSVGRTHWIQAPAVGPILDSLALDTDVVIDPTQPDFVLLMVRNPYRPAAHAVGYLYWWKDRELRYQGVVFTGSAEPRMRVWWTSRPEAPYGWGVLTRERDPNGWWSLMLLRLDPTGTYWNLLQHESNGPDLGAGGQAFWNELNGDDRPEIVAWVRARSDSGFEECTGCPGLISENVFTERETGFDLFDSRLLPSPYSTFMLFVRLLRDRNRAAAARLVQNPAQVDQALALGWGAPARAGGWKLEYVEPRQAWPRWLALRHAAGAGSRLFTVHFTLKDGRWIIRDWQEPGATGKKPASKGAGPR
jgi:hypothetical protein